MREIKFKGKRRDNGEWVYGFFYIYQNAYYIIRENIDISSIVLWKGFHIYEVIKESAGEFTGLYDKNDKKIYEGDVIKCWKENIFHEWKEFIGYIKWDEAGYWKITNGKDWVEAGKFSELREIELIGNKFDNPKLLEITR